MVAILGFWLRRQIIAAEANIKILIYFSVQHYSYIKQATIANAPGIVSLRPNLDTSFWILDKYYGFQKLLDVWIDLVVSKTMFLSQL